MTWGPWASHFLSLSFLLCKRRGLSEVVPYRSRATGMRCGIMYKEYILSKSVAKILEGQRCKIYVRLYD